MSNYKPWSNIDYYQRVRTYTISNWFAKPSIIDPLQCSLYGWRNCSLDMLECETCNNRLYFNIPSKLDSKTVEKRLNEFVKNIQSNGHRDICPWRDNASPSYFANLTNLPFQSQLDAYKKRSNNIYSNFNHLKLISLSDDILNLWNSKQSGEKRNILNVIVSISGLPLTELKSKLSCILALCGWNYLSSNNNNIKNNSSSDKNNNGDLEEKQSIYCSYCQRVCGIWNYDLLDIKSSSSPFKNDLHNNDSNNNILKRKRDNQINEDQEDKKRMAFESSIMSSMMLSTSFGNSFGQSKSSSSSNFGGGSGSFTSEKSSQCLWSWGTSFVHPVRSFEQAKSDSKTTPFSPIQEHRWFCPWSKDTDFKLPSRDNNNNNNTTTTDQQNNNNTTTPGWEFLLNMLLNQSINEKKDFSNLNENRILSLNQLFQ
eukprot:gene9884-12126_t